MATDDPFPTPGSPAAASLALPTLLASRPRLDALGIARVVSEAAEALHKAQRSGPLPGAVTPAAILVSTDGVTLAPGAAAVAYTAPERLTGAAGDRRSDVFTLGVVLWEALTGERLFDASSDEGRAKAVQACDVLAPTEFDDAIPPELDSICKRALARDPADRYPSAKVMAAELVTFLDDVGYPEDRAAIIERVRAALPPPAPVAADSTSPLAGEDADAASAAPVTDASAGDLASLLAGVADDDPEAAPAGGEPAIADDEQTTLAPATDASADESASLLAGGPDDDATAPTDASASADDIASLLAGGADDDATAPTDASASADDIASLLAGGADDDATAPTDASASASADDIASLLAGGHDDEAAVPAPATDTSASADDIASLLAGGAATDAAASADDIASLLAGGVPDAAPAPTSDATASADDIASRLAGGAAPAPDDAVSADDIASLLAGGGSDEDESVSADDIASLLGGGASTPAEGVGADDLTRLLATDGAPAPKADPYAVEPDPYAVEADPYAVEADPDAMEDGDEPTPTAAHSHDAPTPYHALSTGEAVAPEEIDRLIATAQTAPAARATTAEGATTAAAEPPADPTDPTDKPTGKAARPRRTRKAIAFASAGAAMVLAAVAAIALLGGRGEASPQKAATREAPPAAHGDAPTGDEAHTDEHAPPADEHAPAAGEHAPAAAGADLAPPVEYAKDDLTPANEFAPQIVDARDGHAPPPAPAPPVEHAPPIADAHDTHAPPPPPPPAPPITPPPARPAHVDTDPDFAPEAPRVAAADAPKPVYFPAKEPPPPPAGLRRARQAPDRDYTPSREHTPAPAVDPTTGPLEPVSGRGVTVDRAGNIDTTMLYRLGYELLSHGDATAARSTFESLQAQHPTYAPAARGLGLAQEALSNTAGARAAYTRYLELAPTAVDAADIKSRLARLR